MRESKVSIRYAKSLLDLAREKSLLDQVYADTQLIAKVCSENQELVIMLNSPVIKTDKKIAIINQIFAKNVGELTLSFLNLMCKKKREYLLAAIANDFNTLYLKEKGIITAIVRSAVALDDNIKSQIKAKIGTDAEINFIEIIDSSLIGGFIVRVGDKQFDGSIARSIVELKKSFSKNEFIPGF